VCSYGDKKYDKSLALLESTCMQIGKADGFFRYTQEWLKTTEFYLKNRFVLDRPRGAGYWIWKPYVMLESFKKIEDGDVLMYVDAGVKVDNNLTTLKELAIEKGHVFFDLVNLCKIWTKRDCFVLMNADEPKYWNAPQTNAFCQLYVKNEENTNFIKEYLRYCRDPRVVTDDINLCGKPNFLEFKDHRHDQSVLSLLIEKHGYERHADPSQYGNYSRNNYKDTYGQILYHHRNFKH
jgi:hypothetical protein